MYSKKLIYDYIIGNDIDNIEKLESDNNFLFEVLKTSKDISYYHYLDKSYRRSYEVLKYMLLNFKDSLDVYISDIDYLLKNINTKDIEYRELIILLSDADKNKYNKYKIAREAFYTLDKLEITAILDDDKALEEEIGLGFEYILMKYDNNKTICDYYAKCFLYEIFYEDKNIEELIHKRTKTKDEIIKIGNINYLLNYIESLDLSLKEYLTTHTYLLKRLSKDLELIKNNWPNYLERINSQKVAIVYQAVNSFLEEYRGRFYFDCYSLLDEIVYNNNLEDIFNINKDSISKDYIDINESEFLKHHFKRNMTALIKELFKEDIIPKSNSDYNISNGKVIKHKKK